MYRDSGLGLVKYIRETLRDSAMRIILHTGQASTFSKKDVIRDYDINEFLEKREADEEKLGNSAIFALRSFREVDKRVKEISELTFRAGATQSLAMLGELSDFILDQLDKPLKSMIEAMEELSHLLRDSIYKEYGEFYRTSWPSIVRDERQSRFVSLLTSNLLNELIYSSDGLKKLQKFVSRGTLKPEYIRLGPAINSILDFIHFSKMTYIDRPAENGNLAVWGSPLRLHQVFSRLLVNSNEALPKGGNIKISIFMLRYSKPYTYVVYIADNGIPATEKLEKRKNDYQFIQREINNYEGGKFKVRELPSGGTIIRLSFLSGMNHYRD